MSKYAAVSASASGDNTIVAAVAGQKIVLLSYTVIAAGDVSITWKSGASTSLSGAMALAANGGAAPSAGPLAPGAIVGLLETAAGEALVLGLSAAVAVGGHITYRLVTV
jgi:hypothetical protein